MTTTMESTMRSQDQHRPGAHVLGLPPVGALTDGEVAMLRAWAERYAAQQVAAERERCARHIDVPWSRPGAEFAAAIRSSDKA